MIAWARIVVRLLADLAGLVVVSLRPRRSVAAENLFLRRELALYQERGVKRRPGRPPIPLELRQLIRRMASENPLWGEERIANELLLKLGLRVSPRTVRKYMPKRPPGRPPRRSALVDFPTQPRARDRRL